MRTNHPESVSDRQLRIARDVLSAGWSLDTAGLISGVTKSELDRALWRELGLRKTQQREPMF